MAFRCDQSADALARRRLSKMLRDRWMEAVRGALRLAKGGLSWAPEHLWGGGSVGDGEGVGLGGDDVKAFGGNGEGGRTSRVREREGALGFSRRVAQRSRSEDTLAGGALLRRVGITRFSERSALMRFRAVANLGGIL